MNSDSGDFCITAPLNSCQRCDGNGMLYALVMQLACQNMLETGNDGLPLNFTPL